MKSRCEKYRKIDNTNCNGSYICSHITFLPATGVENNVYMDSGNCISSVDGNSSAVHWRDKEMPGKGIVKRDSEKG